MYPILMGKQQYRFSKEVMKMFAPNVIDYLPLTEPNSGQDYLTSSGTGATKVDCGTDTTLEDLPTGAFTYDLWLNVSSSHVEDGACIVMGKRWYHHISIINASTAPEVRITIDFDGTDIVSSASGIVKDQWHHIAVTYDDLGDRKTRIYLDGAELVTSSAATGSYVSDAGLNFVILDEIWTGRYSFMSIGWVRVSDNRRWTAEFTGSVPPRQTIPTVDANTISLWSMDEGYGTVAGDQGPNDNDGTITQGDWGSYPQVNDISGYGNHVIYSGQKLGSYSAPGNTGGGAPEWDGVNDHIKWYTATINSNFDGAEGGVICFGLNASGWGVGDPYPRLFNVSGVGWNDEITWRAHQGNLYPQCITKFNTTPYVWSPTAQPGTDEWFMCGVSWSQTDDKIVQYFNTETNTINSPAAWSAANLLEPYSLLGASHTAPSNVWIGGISNFILLNRAFTTAEYNALWALSGLGS